MESGTENYERKMRSLYADQAAAKFKQEFDPADPFDGVLIDAADLEIPQLVTIYKATKHLESKGHYPFVNTLILSRGEGKTPLVRVNSQCADRCRFVDRLNRPKIIKVCELLGEFFWGTDKTFADKRKEIGDMNDPQLLEYVQQVEENLELTVREMEVIVDAN